MGMFSHFGLVHCLANVFEVCENYRLFGVEIDQSDKIPLHSGQYALLEFLRLCQQTNQKGMTVIIWHT